MLYSRIETPLGRLLLVSRGEGLSGLYFDHHPRGPQPQAGWSRDDPAFHAATAQLSEYLDGAARGFQLTLDLRGTPFQQAVWNELLTIPYGMTISYAGLAKRIGRPTAARAVGRANALNPVSIVVPCHRVTGANDQLTGYAGGLSAKRWLLDLERSGRPLLEREPRSL